MKRKRPIRFAVTSSILSVDKYIDKKNPTQEYIVRELSKVMLSKYPRMYISFFLRPSSPKADKWYYYLPEDNNFPPEYKISHELISKKFKLPFNYGISLYTNRSSKGAVIESKICSSAPLIGKKVELYDTSFQIQILSYIIPEIRSMIFNHEYDIVYKRIDNYPTYYDDTPDRTRYYYYIAFPFFRFIEEPFTLKL